MTLKRIILLFICSSILASCNYIPGLDNVVTDRRKEYRKSDSMDDLEIPPDLTLEADVDPLIIPGEEAATYTEYQRQRSLRGTGTGTGTETPIATLDNEQVVVLAGNPVEIWPGLREFWQVKDYQLDLDDAELGVMETQWRETGNEGVTAARNRFRIFSEPGPQPGTTLLFVSSERQERLPSSSGGEGTWLEVEKDLALEKNMTAQIKQHFTGASVLSTATGTQRVPARAEIRNLSDERMLLAVPDDYSTAWRLTGQALQRSGFLIRGEDAESGIYDILYFTETEEEGMLSSLKFWGDNEPKGKPYQLSLSPSGQQTELTVLDENGDMASRDEATPILVVLQSYYNSQRR